MTSLAPGSVRSLLSIKLLHRLSTRLKRAAKVLNDTYFSMSCTTRIASKARDRLKEAVPMAIDQCDSVQLRRVKTDDTDVNPALLAKAILGRSQRSCARGETGARLSNHSC